MFLMLSLYVVIMPQASHSYLFTSSFDLQRSKRQYKIYLNKLDFLYIILLKKSNIIKNIYTISEIKYFLGNLGLLS